MLCEFNAQFDSFMLPRIMNLLALCSWHHHWNKDPRLCSLLDSQRSIWSGKDRRHSIICTDPYERKPLQMSLLPSIAKSGKNWSQKGISCRQNHSAWFYYSIRPSGKNSSPGKEAIGIKNHNAGFPCELELLRTFLLFLQNVQHHLFLTYEDWLLALDSSKST